MFNNINDNNKDFLQSAHWELQSNVVKLNALKANTLKSSYSKNDSPFVDKTEISSNALAMFQKDCDINKFNKIAMSDMSDLSHLDLMKDLFNQGVVDAYEDEVLEELVNNQRLWDDLAL